MDRDLALLEEAATAFGVRMHCYGEDLAGLEEYDDGLRSRILQKYDAMALGIFITSIESGTMFICTDLYGCHYCLFPLPPSVREGGTFYCVIGPWQESPPDDAGLAAVIRGSAIHQYLHSELDQYLAWVPHVNIHSWEVLLLALVSELYGEKYRFNMLTGNRTWDTLARSTALNLVMPFPCGILRNVTKTKTPSQGGKPGDVEKAFQHTPRFSGQYEQIVPEKLRNMKNYLLILDTRLRKVVENGYVHPAYAYIDAVSGDFIFAVSKTSQV